SSSVAPTSSPSNGSGIDVGSGGSGGSAPMPDNAGGADNPGAGGAAPEVSAGGNAAGGAGEPEPEPPDEETCPLPDTLRWSSTGPIAQPKSGWVSLKDFTVVVHEGQHIVYMTNHDTGTSWGAAMFS